MRHEHFFLVPAGRSLPQRSLAVIESSIYSYKYVYNILTRVERREKEKRVCGRFEYRRPAMIYTLLQYANN